MLLALSLLFADSGGTETATAGVSALLGASGPTAVVLYLVRYYTQQTREERAEWRQEMAGLVSRIERMEDRATSTQLRMVEALDDLRNAINGATK